MEISKVIPPLIRSFDFSLVNPEMPPKNHNVWFVKQKDIKVSVKPREIGRP